MQWIIDTLTLYFEYAQVKLSDSTISEYELLDYTFKFVETSSQKTGNYKQVKGKVYVNLANHEGIKQRWTTAQRILLGSKLPISNEIQDIKTGYVTFEIDVIINNNIE